ncbi:MAG: fibronectin type III domain-containing protein [Luteolibacter sp.]
MTVLPLPITRFLRGMRLPGSTPSKLSVHWSRTRGNSINALGCLLLASSNLLAGETSSVTLEWDANPESNIAGYRLSFGTTLGTYPDFVDVDTSTSATVSGLGEGATYYFVVAAVNTVGLMGPPSEMVSYVVPVTPPVSPPPAPDLPLDQPKHSPPAPVLDSKTQEPTPEPTPTSPVDPTDPNPKPDKSTATEPTPNDIPVSKFPDSDPPPSSAKDPTPDVPHATDATSVNPPADHAPPPEPILLPEPTPPSFASSSFQAADANEGFFYSGQAIAVQTTDNQPVSYWKISGPAWLEVATDGSLSGTPPLGSTGLNTFHIRAANAASLTADTELRIVVNWLPVPWQSGRVGTGSIAGWVTHGAGTFHQNGSGALGGIRDGFRLTFQRLSGDGEITAKVGSMPPYEAWAHVGVMMRDSMGQNSRHVFFGLTNPTSYRLLSRAKGGGKTATRSMTSAAGADTWVRLVRTGKKITAYRSNNGINWTFSGSAKVTLSRECYIGLAVASGGNAVDFTAQFSNVYVIP